MGRHTASHKYGLSRFAFSTLLTSFTAAVPLVGFLILGVNCVSIRNGTTVILSDHFVLKDMIVALVFWRKKRLSVEIPAYLSQSVHPTGSNTMNSP